MLPKIAYMGHDEGGSKNPRGLTAASVLGAADTVTWRLQGSLGGETPVDPVRGAMNSGGLFGDLLLHGDTGAGAGA